jgi:AcrR family transcriptional regulator
MTAVRTGGRRERLRAATITEIKQTALGLMHEQGTTNVRFTDIARVMGMTPPALYRYFADRDELLTALITDGYDDLGRALAEAQAGVPPGDLAARWLAGAQAYRQWAKREPQQFALILGLPVPGYSAPEEGPTTEAARRAMNQLAAMFAEAQRRGVLRRPLVRDVSPVMKECALQKGEELGGEVPPENFQAMLHAWASLQGFISLEAYGHFNWMEPDARDALFVSQMRLAAECAGMPVPGPD